MPVLGSSPNPDVEEALQADPGPHTRRDDPALRVFGTRGDQKTPDRDQHDQNNDGTAADKTEGLADHGEDKVCL